MSSDLFVSILFVGCVIWLISRSSFLCIENREMINAGSFFVEDGYDQIVLA
jgi:hypothetical protein